MLGGCKTCWGGARMKLGGGGGGGAHPPRKFASDISLKMTHIFSIYCPRNTMGALERSCYWQNNGLASLTWF